VSVSARCFFIVINVVVVVVVVVVATGRSARSAVDVTFLLSGPKMGFSPAGATHCPDKRKIWHGRAKFQICRAEMWEYSSQNCQNFEFLA